jgi:DNA polymerase alpha subunit B
MIVAAGPFSTDSDLKFTPWHNFMSKVQTSKPAIVVLVSHGGLFPRHHYLCHYHHNQLGPFVDCEHPRIKSFAIEHTPAEMFQSHIIGSLNEFLAASPGSVAVIIPSVKDIISDHACYPQAGLKARDLGSEDPVSHSKS